MKQYIVDISITREDQLIDKRFVFNSLDEARNLDWNKLIDDTEENEKEAGLDQFVMHDETENFREIIAGVDFKESLDQLNNL